MVWHFAPCFAGGNIQVVVSVRRTCFVDRLVWLLFSGSFFAFCGSSVLKIFRMEFSMTDIASSCFTGH